MVKIFYRICVDGETLSASLSGPSSIYHPSSGTFSTIVNGGNGNISYKWYIRNSNSNNWGSIVGTSPTHTLYPPSSPGYQFKDIKVVVTRNGITKSAIISHINLIHDGNDPF